MTDEEAIFDQALRKGSASERNTYLDEACAGNADLRREVEALLLAHQKAAGILEAPLAGIGAAGVSHFSSEGVGSTVGPYKLLEQIGGGGMGVVYMAEQLRPVRRKVALKIIKPGMDSGQVIARFEAERQALTMMDHPNIAKVLDAGTTDTGRPYFVMELVKGIAITDYCDQVRLATRERLELFIQVCHAVQHAHQKGIIHRDLKPTNVLVTLHDDKPVPKVIDFGIAKAAGPVLTERTLFTNYAQMLGTPLYMSPEQAQISGLDVDTRSDVYSLGVLLYELLTGTTPFDKQRLRDAAYDEMRRIIREEDPPNPSTRLSAMGNKLTAISAHRHTEPKKLGQVMRGELDWIVMKSLEKDRTRRYETASGLAMDIQRHLADERVLACPPSKLYLLRKLVRRNKLTFAVVAVVLLALAVGFATATIGFVQASRQRAIAEANATRADREADKQRAVNRFLNDMLGSADPYGLSATDLVKGRTITVLEALDSAAKALEAGSLKDRPEIEAAVRRTLGNTYWHLGQAAAAETHLRAALKLNRQVYGPDDPNVAESLRDLGRAIGANRLLQDDPLYQEVVAMRQRLLGEENPRALGSLNDLTSLLGARGRPEAEQLYRDALRIQRRAHGSEHADVAEALVGLAGIVSTEHPAEAERLYREGLAMQRKLFSSEQVEVAMTLSLLANFLVTRDPAEARQLYEESLAIRRKLLTGDHPDVAVTLIALAGLLANEGKGTEAEGLRREALAILRRALGEEHPQTVIAVTALAIGLQNQGDFPGSEEVLREALALRRELLGDDHTLVATCLSQLTIALQRQGKLADAEATAREAVAMRRRLHPEASSAISVPVFVLASVLRDRGKFDEAAAFVDERVVNLRNTTGADNTRVTSALSQVGAGMRNQKMFARSEEMYRQLLEMRRRINEASMLGTMISLTGVLREQGKVLEAEAMQREVLAETTRRIDRNPSDVAMLLQRGVTNSELRQWDAAMADYRLAIALAQNANVAVRTNLGIACLRLAENVALDPKHQQVAQSASQAAIALFQQLVNIDPKNGYYVRSLANSQFMLADAMLKTGRAREAAQLIGETLQTFEKLSERFPNRPFHRQEQALSHSHLAVVLELLGEIDAADRHYRQAIRLYEGLFAEFPVMRSSASDEGLTTELSVMTWERGARIDNADARNRLTKLLLVRLVAQQEAATLDAAQMRELAKEPLELAQKTVQLQPRSSRYWQTLGWAHYRAGDWTASVGALEKSIELQESPKGGDPRQWFGLAMAHWKLDNKDEARKWYERAVAWMDENQPNDEELNRLRAEAGEMIARSAPATQP